MTRNRVNYLRAEKDVSLHTYVTTSSAITDRRAENVLGHVPDARTFTSPGSVRSFQHDAFREARLRGAVLNAGLQSLEDLCFYKSGLRVICFPTNPVKIKSWALNSSEKLRVRFAEGTETIQNNALTSSEVSEVAVPASVREIGEGAFSHCKKLTRVTFAPGSRLETIGDGAFFDTDLREFVAPPGLRALGAHCFAGCRELQKMVLGESVQSAGPLCFWGTEVESVPAAIAGDSASLGLGQKNAEELRFPADMA